MLRPVLRFATAAAVVAAVVSASGARAAAEAIELTLYRTRVAAVPPEVSSVGVKTTSYAVVRERRSLRLEAGINRIRLERIPAAVELSSLRLASLTDPEGFRVGSIRSLGGTVEPTAYARPGPATLELRGAGRVSGAIVAQSSHHILFRHGAVLELVNRAAITGIDLGEAGGVVEVSVEVARAATHEVELVYQTGGLSWDMAYVAIRAGAAVNLSATLEIDNDTGIDFGEVAVNAVYRSLGSAIKGRSYGVVAIHAPGERFGFAVGRIPVPPGDSERSLFAVRNVAATPVLVYEPRPGHRSSQRFPDTSCPRFAQPPSSGQAALALELRPGAAVLDKMVRGSFRVLEEDKPGEARPTAVGVVEIDRRAGAVRLKIGNRSDISSRRNPVRCTVDLSKRRLVETIDLEVDSQASEPVDVLVRTHLSRWPGWVIAEESKQGASWARGREYRIALMPRASETIRYTVVYTW